MTAYPDVEKELNKLVTHVDDLPALKKLAEIPKASTPVDMSIFARAAKAIRRLPEAKPTEHSQFFNDSAQVEIAGYKSLYAKTLKLFGEKARVPVLAAFNNVVPSGNFEAMSREDVAPSSALRAAPAA